MITQERCLALIQIGLDNLHESSLLPEKVSVGPETVLLGVGAMLDSIGFVTFVSDMEDRLSRELGREIFFVLDDIQDFNVTNPFLSAAVLAAYMERLAG